MEEKHGLGNEKRMFMLQSWCLHFIRQTRRHLGEYSLNHKSTRGRVHLEGGVMSGDAQLMPLPSIHKHEAFVLCLC
jgi:hypothetical protein